MRLTDDELNELMRLHPDDYLEMIENMSTYMRSNGKVYASDVYGEPIIALCDLFQLSCDVLGYDRGSDC